MTQKGEIDMAKEATGATRATSTPVEEPTYDASEIAANVPHLFGYSVDMATAALAYNGVTRCTLEKARTTIKTFAERKVN